MSRTAGTTHPARRGGGGAANDSPLPLRRLRTEAWQRLVVSFIRSATRPLRAADRAAALRFGTRLGELGYRIAAGPRRRARKNLELAYRDELSPAERDALIRGVFRHFGRCLAEFVRAPLYDADALRGLIVCEGWERYEEAAAQGRGVLIVTGHFGNWELLGRWLALTQKVPLTVVARDPHDPALAAFLRETRENGGFTVLSKGASASGLLRAIKRRETALLLPDQNSGDLFAPFFGVPAGTVAGPASVALHTGAPVLPIFCAYDPVTTGYHVRVLPPLDTAPTGDADADKRRITAEMNRVLETVIREQPDQWLWLHNRWKSAFEEKNRARAWPDGAAPPTV